jgi:hypothetical protein
VTELLLVLGIVAVATCGASIIIAQQARSAFDAWLVYRREQERPSAAQPPAPELEGRMQRLELELASLKVERLTGRR